MTSPTPLRALVTLGPTHESVDAVRFIGNRSSGRMGTEIARALQQAGCDVQVLAGPCQPAGMDSLNKIVRFRCAAELKALLEVHWPSHDLLIMAAAVADWKPANQVQGKMRRQSATLSLSLEPVPEILGSLTTRPNQFIVGFALEPSDELLSSARDKLQRKRADCVVANPLETMDADLIAATLLWPEGRVERPGDGSPWSKQACAGWLCERFVPAAIAKRCGG